VLAFHEVILPTGGEEKHLPKASLSNNDYTIERFISSLEVLPHDEC